MQPLPQCQALSLGPGRAVAAMIVRRAADEPPQPRYHHFHPAAELVWFRAAESRLHCAGIECRTGTGDLVYLPSMTPHDFAVAPGQTAFALVFFDPRLAMRLPGALRARLDGPRILTPDPVQAARIDMVAEWLVESTASAPPAEMEGTTAANLLDLLLTVVARKGRPLAAGPAQMAGPHDPLVRLQRAIAMVHDNPGQPHSLAQAAAACNLSPAYFARLFKERIGQTFADYLQAHRLNLAAELVGASDLGIAEIAWRSGFGSPAHLSARFSARFGMSPSRYRRAARDRTTSLATPVLPGADTGPAQDRTSLSQV